MHGYAHIKTISAFRITCTNLLEPLNDWTRNIQDGFPTVVIYINFSKAFDVVQHDKLFVKLQAIGIDGKLRYLNGLKICSMRELFRPE